MKIKHCIVIVLLYLLTFFGFVSSAFAEGDLKSIYFGTVHSEEEGIYYDDPCDCWLDRDSSFLFGAKYYRQFTQSLWLGFYAENENISIKDSDDSASRIGFGASFLGRTGQQSGFTVGLEVGGNFGYALISLPNDLDSQAGFDYEVFFGPYFGISQGLSFSTTIHLFNGWYEGGESPEGIGFAQPRLKFNLYF